MPWNPLACAFGKVVVPRRFLLIIMMQLALINAYHMRVVLNIAITEMVEDQNLTLTIDACPMFQYEKVESITGGTFPWGHNMEALILYAFFISYFVSHVPGGWLADRFGGRHVMGTCLMISSISTILFPLGTQLFGSVGAVILRMILGLAQGPLLPAISSFIQCWVPPEHRGFYGGVALGGSNFGTVSGGLLTGVIIHHFNSWSAAFYIWGSVSLVYCFFFYMIVFSKPSTDPYITPSELEYLHVSIEYRKSFKVPWIKISTSVAVWALLAGQFAHSLLFFILLIDLPKYMKDILKLNVRANGIASSLPFLCLWISIFVFSYSTDYFINKGYWSVIFARRLNTACAVVIPCFLLMVIVLIGCHREGAIVVVFCILFLMGPFFSGMKVNINDITSHYSGTIMAIVNGFGSTAGILGPFIIGYLTSEKSLENWFYSFLILTAINSTLAFIYVMFAKVERQEWDYNVDDE